MSFAAAVEIVTFNRTGPAFAFAGSGYIYGFANTKKIGANFLADLYVFINFIFINAKFADNLGEHSGLLKVPALGLGNFFSFFRAYLQGCVAVCFACFYLCYNVRACRKKSHGNSCAL